MKLKEKYIEIIRSMDLEESLESVVVNFVEECGQENNQYFDLFMINLLPVLREHKRLKIKAEGYDKVLEINKDFERSIENLKKEHSIMKDLDKGALSVSSDNAGETGS